MDYTPGPSRTRSSTLDSARRGKTRLSDESSRQRTELPPQYDDLDDLAKPGQAFRARQHREDDLDEDDEDVLHFGGGIESEYDLERDGRRARESEDEDGLKHLATVEQKKALWWRNVTITALFIASWYVWAGCRVLGTMWYGFATLLSLYNKWMFTPEYYNFPYPLFVTFCHMIVQFLLAGAIRVIWADKFRPPERPTRQEYVQKVTPTALSTVGDIGLSNMSLKIITLSLYTMAKSSALLFVLFFAFLFHVEKYSHRLLGVVLLISSGVFLMVFNSTAVSIPGLIMVFSASALSGLRWALTELVMHKKAMGLSNPFATVFWLAPLMAVAIGVVSIFAEGWIRVFSSDHFQGFQAIKTMGYIVFPGTIAFAMVASEYFIIHRAGSVPLSIAGIFKEVSTITISAWVFGDELTRLNMIGVAVTVSGIALYTFHKYQKSISEPVPLDEHGQPIDEEAGGERHFYARAPSTHESTHLSTRGATGTYTDNDGVPLTSLSSSASVRGQAEAAEAEQETAEERANRLRDDFEGWDREDEEWSDADDDDDDGQEPGLDEVAARRDERVGSKGKSWGEWWDKSM